MRHQQFILGEHVRALEDEVSKYCGTSAGIGVSSGTDALLLALMALKMAPATRLSPHHLRFSQRRERLRGSGRARCFATSTRRVSTYCLVAVQGYIDRLLCAGRRAPHEPHHRRSNKSDDAGASLWAGGRQEPLMQIARRYHLRVIEDAAQAIGTEDKNGTRVGSIGDIGCFSFFQQKIRRLRRRAGSAPPTILTSPRTCAYYCGCTAQTEIFSCIDRRQLSYRRIAGGRPARQIKVFGWLDSSKAT